MSQRVQSGERSLSWDKKCPLASPITQDGWQHSTGTVQGRVPSVTGEFERSSSSTPQADEPFPRGLAQGTQPLELAESTRRAVGEPWDGV